MTSKSLWVRKYEKKPEAENKKDNNNYCNNAVRITCCGSWTI